MNIIFVVFFPAAVKRLNSKATEAEIEAVEFTPEPCTCKHWGRVRPIKLYSFLFKDVALLGYK